MAHDTRSSPPVALRVVRPFATEAELLEAEASAFTRTGVVLIGATSRPNGVVLRFEITLRDGSAVMRGEGRVVGHRPPSGSDEGALMLRFTRLDVKSKSLLDRAVAIREERRSLMPPAAKPNAPAPIPSRPPLPPRPSGGPPRPPSVGAMRAAPSAPPRPAIPSVAPTVQAAPSPPPSEVLASIDVQVDVDVDDEGTGEVDLSEMQEVQEAQQAREADEAHEAHEAEDVAPVALDESDLTVQAPPVEMIASGPAPRVPPPEHMPAPSPSPARVPAPHPIAPEPQAPPVQAPERIPAPHHAPERMPPPQRSPEPVRKLETNVREGALERLRTRAKKLTELGSMFPVGERSSGPNQPPVTAAPNESMTPVLGSYVVGERDEKQQ